MRWPKSLTFPREPDFIIAGTDGIYLRRWWIIPRNRVFNIYLHQFLASDDDRALHDHPWLNVSCLLRGRYIEVTPSGERLRSPFRPVFRRATALHRVVLINGSPVWSLFITGPVIREWGFACPNGWRSHHEFAAVQDNVSAIGRGCD